LFPQWCPLRNRKQKHETLVGVVAPRGRWRLNDAAKKEFRCCSTSESVFAGILDQIFRGFIDSKNVFSDAEVLKICQIYVLGVKYIDKCMCHECHDVSGVCGKD